MGAIGLLSLFGTGRAYRLSKVNEVRVMAIICALTWGCLAIKVQTLSEPRPSIKVQTLSEPRPSISVQTIHIAQAHFFGAMGLFALFILLACTERVLPICYAVGFGKSYTVPKIMNVALYFMLTHICIMLRGLNNHQYLSPFMPGIFLMGGITYLTGCLVVSSKQYVWCQYYHDHAIISVFCNVLTVESGFIIFLLGSIPSLEIFRRLVGTFLIILMFKAWEEMTLRLKS